MKSEELIVHMFGLDYLWALQWAADFLVCCWLYKEKVKQCLGEQETGEAGTMVGSL